MTKMNTRHESVVKKLETELKKVRHELEEANTARMYLSSKLDEKQEMLREASKPKLELNDVKNDLLRVQKEYASMKAELRERQEVIRDLNSRLDYALLENDTLNRQRQGSQLPRTQFSPNAIYSPINQSPPYQRIDPNRAWASYNYLPRSSPPPIPLSKRSSNPVELPPPLLPRQQSYNLNPRRC